MAQMNSYLLLLESLQEGDKVTSVWGLVQEVPGVRGKCQSAGGEGEGPEVPGVRGKGQKCRG